MTMFTADQIVAHLVGDYILQSHWMATEKTKQSFAAAVHAVCYTLPFLFITQSLAALAVICGTHFVIDRWRLARFVVWLKNWPVAGTAVEEVAPAFNTFDGPARRVVSQRVILWKPLTATGYQDDVPAWLSVWLLIIADNTLHILCNGVAVWGLGQ